MKSHFIQSHNLAYESCTYDSRAYDAGDQMVPTECQIDTAFDILLDDEDMISLFVETVKPNYIKLIQLLCKEGIPLGNNSPRNDNLHLQYFDWTDGFCEDYREWLGSTLTDKADEIMILEHNQNLRDSRSW